MNRDLDQSDAKKIYEPPRLTTISLRPEEAVLGACKVLGASGPGQPGGCGVLCGNAGS
ncbi:MAG: hypothetical protein WBM24_12960 [Candidatus Sulfotelmatobacter sp.]